MLEVKTSYLGQWIPVTTQDLVSFLNSSPENPQEYEWKRWIRTPHSEISLQQFKNKPGRMRVNVSYRNTNHQKTVTTGNLVELTTKENKTQLNVWPVKYWLNNRGNWRELILLDRKHQTEIQYFDDNNSNEWLCSCPVDWTATDVKALCSLVRLWCGHCIMENPTPELVHIVTEFLDYPLDHTSLAFHSESELLEDASEDLKEFWNRPNQFYT